MKNDEKREELQSRREFFKNAAKTTLPVIGAIVLAAAPSVAKAETAPMGCSYGYCMGSCKGTCDRLCLDNCTSSCKGTCQNTCSGGCKNSSSR